MEKRKTGFRTYLTDGEAGINISWGSIFAGVITFLSIFITLSNWFCYWIWHAQINDGSTF